MEVGQRGLGWEGAQQRVRQASLCLVSYRVQTTFMLTMSVATTNRKRSSSHKVCRVRSKLIPVVTGRHKYLGTLHA